MMVLGWAALLYIVVGVTWAVADTIDAVLAPVDMEAFLRELRAKVGLTLGPREAWIFMFALTALFWPMSMREAAANRD